MIKNAIIIILSSYVAGVGIYAFTAFDSVIGLLLLAAALVGIAAAVLDHYA